MSMNLRAWCCMVLQSTCFMNSECIVLPGASEHKLPGASERKLDEAMPTFLPGASEHGVEMQVHHGALRAYSCRVLQSTAGHNAGY